MHTIMRECASAHTHTHSHTLWNDSAHCGMNEGTSVRSSSRGQIHHRRLCKGKVRSSSGLESHLLGVAEQTLPWKLPPAEHSLGSILDGEHDVVGRALDWGQGSEPS